MELQKILLAPETKGKGEAMSYQPQPPPD